VGRVELVDEFRLPFRLSEVSSFRPQGELPPLDISLTIGRPPAMTEIQFNPPAVKSLSIFDESSINDQPEFFHRHSREKAKQGPLRLRFFMQLLLVMDSFIDPGGTR
jgi:hypothetical protein